MKLLSLFDGEGGFPLAAVMNGIEPVAASEIEPYPIAITRSRFPNMKHLGDVSLINGAEIEPVDIVTFGSPCQSMSVAGKREGLKHESQGDEQTTRSGLFFESIRIITEMRKATNGKYPRFAVWENVPGAFSSGGGRDFLAVLQAFATIAEPTISIPEPERDRKTDNLIWLGAGSIVGNNFSIAWRTLDAQYWGVPQRRKRIYLVADFGSERAADLLLERYSLRGNIAESGETRERIAEDAIGRADGSLGIECLNPWDSQSERVYSDSGVHPSVNANSGGGQDRHAVVYSFDSLSSNSMKSSNPNTGCREVDAAKCIDTTFPDPSKNQGGVCVVQPCEVYPNVARPLLARYDSSPCIDRGSDVIVQSAGFAGKASSSAGSVGFGDETGETLRAGQETHCVIDTLCFDTTQTLAGMTRDNNVPHVIAFAQNQRDEVRDLNGVAGSVAAEAGTHQQTFIAQPVIALQANGIDRADTAGCNDAGWREDQSYTLNTVDRHAVCYQENVGSLCARDYKGVGNQYVDESKLVIESPRLATRQRSDEFAMCDVASTESHRQYKDATDIVIHKDNSRRYIVRRLMPIETTRLQGFPDFWHHLAPFDGDVEFWESVRKTWAGINGTTYKPFKDVARLEKWYYGLRNDGAEYKVDGNSLAMPCAEYVIRRIAETVREEEKLSAEERI